MVKERQVAERQKGIAVIGSSGQLSDGTSGVRAILVADSRECRCPPRPRDPARAVRCSAIGRVSAYLNAITI
jgi:hypothetical protein